jgi:hypothetical protein
MIYTASLDKVHDAFNVISQAVNELDVVSLDLERVGFEHLVERLHGPRFVLRDALKTLRDDYSRQITDQCNDAQQSSLNVLNATLAGVDLAYKAANGRDS